MSEFDLPEGARRGPTASLPGIGLVLTGTAILLVLGLAGCGKTGRTDAPRVLVLGIDGLDPDRLEGFFAEGKLPNLKSLRDKGGLRRLETSVPPQSPVAWSNFITGMNPGGHGIFDFVHRSLETDTPTPKFSASDVSPVTWSLPMGSYTLPLAGGSPTNERKGRAFWEILADHGIPASVYKIPVNYPPSPSIGVTMSGMGTPDLLGSQGTSFFFTDNPPRNAASAAGVTIKTVLVDEGVVRTAFEGPPHPLLSPEAQKKSPPLLCPLVVYIDNERTAARIEVSGQSIILEEGEWSEWVTVSFDIPLPGPDMSAAGICRFYLKSLSPDFALYASPVNLDPRDPASAVTEPAEAAVDLATWMRSPYYTQNMPEDFNALGAEVISADDFRTQSAIVVKERKKILDYALERFDAGLLFFYMGSVDLSCHMMFRTLDPRHPAYRADLAARHADWMQSVYEEADDVVGTALRAAGENTTVIVMSDHGFAPFYREFQLANWLRDHGYIVTTEKDDGTLAIDWRKTRAYSMGINGLYLNLKKREKCGIVEKGAEAEQLLAEISYKLLEVRDEDPRFAGNQVVDHVYRTTECYSGSHVDEAPDLVVGYNRGYRSADDAGLCSVTHEPVLRDRNEWWSGDHCMSHKLVPGVLLSSRTLGASDPALYDLPVTILELYGIARPEEMVGKSVY